MRIALFTDSYLPTVDGVVTSVLSTRRQLEAHGHEVVVFAPEDPRRRGMREAGTIYVRAKEFRHYPGYRLAMFPGRETDLIKDLGIDVIHIHGVGFVGIKGILASWQAKVPRVSTFHTMIHDLLPFYSPFGLNLHLLERGLRFYLRVFLRKTKGVVVPSRAVLEEILALSPAAKIADVIPTGVDPERFHPGNPGQGIRTKWGLNGHDVLLHVGRVAPEKNLTTLIQAFPEFVGEGVNGALFEPNDVRGCAAAVLRCLRKSDEMAEAARETALQYSVERCTRRLERVYERLIAS